MKQRNALLCNTDIWSIFVSQTYIHYIYIYMYGNIYIYIYAYVHIHTVTGHSGRIIRVRASRAGDREFGSWLSQTSDL